MKAAPSREVEILHPDNEAQVLDAVRWAAAEEVRLELRSGGTKRALGRPVRADRTLDLSGLSGIALHEPEELVMSCGPGTSLAEVAAALSASRQQLAFEPPDLGPLLGAPAGEATLGGVFSCNLSGPRRIKAGAARDHLLGLSAVSGRGEAFKAGGRVVKNVTGYDVCKLMTGAYGTLGALTGLTFKVLPAPEETRTVVVRGLEDEAAVEAMGLALRSPHDVSGAAHLPAALGGEARTAIRLEGFGPSVAYRSGKLTEALSAFGEMDFLDDEVSADFWRGVRDVRPFVGDDRIVWKLSVPPAQGAAVAAAIGAAHFFDWGGGLIWVALPPEEIDGAARVRAAVDASGGHATLVRAPDSVRGATDVFHPQPAALAALTARIKDSFDPKRILNPGRMYPGI
ncbi:glycolate oxidase subunit GlcE [Inquilinus sp. CAU 1745]|uniref:glycolate oxidase subunit GlcE n=1 Tax=Inquilinus sp. CAU 1745 TaxID=3140369 RepID=UPI00325AB7AC